MTLKDSILACLAEKPGQAVSGQDMAEKFGISRNAVWKSIVQLRQEGYEIRSATNRGYALADSGRLCEALIRAYMGGAAPVYGFDSIDSTNTEAKRRILAGESGFLVLAERQTAGRGRRGRSFFSPAGSGLYMSAALSVDIPLEQAVNVTSYAAVCVRRAIKEITGLECGIKWVNDLYLDGKKVCGILTEAVTDFESGSVAGVVVGIGVNLTESAVPEELRSIVGFLGCEGVKNRLAAAIAQQLFRFDGEDRSYMADYRAYSAVLGREVSYTVSGEKRRGVAADIDDAGGLVVETAAGRDILRSGEISLESIEGLK